MPAVGEGCWWLAMVSSRWGKGMGAGRDGYQRAIRQRPSSGKQCAGEGGRQSYVRQYRRDHRAGCGVKCGVPWLFVPRDRADERVAYGRGSRGERQECAERAGQSDRVVSGNADAREKGQQCKDDGRWAALRWMGAPRILTVAEGA